MSSVKSQSQQEKLNELLKSIPETSNRQGSCSRGTQLASALKEAYNQKKTSRLGVLSSD